MTFGGLLFMAIPIVITIYIGKTDLWAGSRLCVRWFAGMAALHYLAFLVISMMSFGWTVAISMDYAQTSPFIMFFLAIYMIVLLMGVRKLDRLEKELGRKRDAAGREVLSYLAVVLVFLISPFLRFQVSDMFGAVWNILPF